LPAVAHGEQDVDSPPSRFALRRDRLRSKKGALARKAGPKGRPRRSSRRQPRAKSGGVSGTSFATTSSGRRDNHSRHDLRSPAEHAPPDAEDVCQHERDGRSVAATRRAQPPDHLIGAASTAASATAVSQEPASLGISAEQPVSILLAKGNLCRVGRRGTRPLSPFLWRGAPVRRGPLGGLCGLITRWVGPCPDGPHGGDASRRQRSQRRSARSRAARRVPSRRRQRRRSSTRSR